MNHEYLAHQLAYAFRARPVQVGAGSFVPRRAPVYLAAILDAALDTDEERVDYAGTFEAWPGHVHEALDRRLLKLLTFVWDSLGPMSWVAGVELLTLDDARFLVYWDELQSFRAFARVNTVNADVITTALVPFVAAGCDQSWNSIPTETTNHAPQLVQAGRLRDAYGRFLDAAPDQDFDGWGGLASEHFSRLVEPDHLRRSLDLLETLPSLDDDGAIDRWLESNIGPELDEDARARLLDEWWTRSYEEHPAERA